MTPAQVTTGFAPGTTCSKRRHWAWNAVLTVTVISVLAPGAMAFPAAGDPSDYDYETWAVTGLLDSSKNSELKDRVKISENSGEDTEGFQNDAAFSAEQFERAEVSM